MASLRIEDRPAVPKSFLSGSSPRRHREEATLSDIHHSRKRSRGDPPQLNDLPVEVLSDILSRLPLPSFLGFARYTCKLWFSIINKKDSTFFSELQLTRNTNNLPSPPGLLYTLPGHSNLYFAPNHVIDHCVKLPGDLGGSDYRLFGSCRGLLWYYSMGKRTYNVCNPIIDDHVELPPNPCRSISFLPITVGFGYACMRKRYKFVQFSVLWKCQTKLKRGMKAWIVSLGDQSWRGLDIPFVINKWQSAVYCNGILYWMLADLSKEYQLLSFDLDTEEFRARRVLPIDARAYLKRCYLTVLGETVGFVKCIGVRLQEVWMLVDEAEDIWVEKYQMYLPNKAGADNARFTLSGLWMNRKIYGMAVTTTKLRPRLGRGSVYYQYKIRLLSYDTESKEYDFIQLPFVKDTDADSVLPGQFIAHVGSLLSPSAIVEELQRTSHHR